jgi:predicted Fe-Mo cluster-binding NifX family protein
MVLSVQYQIRKRSFIKNPVFDNKENAGCEIAEILISKNIKMLLPGNLARRQWIRSGITKSKWLLLK